MPSARGFCRLARLSASCDAPGGSQPRSAGHQATLLPRGPRGRRHPRPHRAQSRLPLPLLISGLPEAKKRDAAPGDQRMVTLPLPLPPTIAQTLWRGREVAVEVAGSIPLRL